MNFLTARALSNASRAYPFQATEVVLARIEIDKRDGSWRLLGKLPGHLGDKVYDVTIEIFKPDEIPIKISAKNASFSFVAVVRAQVDQHFTEDMLNRRREEIKVEQRIEAALEKLGKKYPREVSKATLPPVNETSPFQSRIDIDKRDGSCWVQEGRLPQHLGDKVYESTIEIFKPYEIPVEISVADASLSFVAVMKAQVNQQFTKRLVKEIKLREEE